MTDDPNVKHSHPAEEKEESHRTDEEQDPKRHGHPVTGDDDDGRTGTGLGSTDS